MPATLAPVEKKLQPGDVRYLEGPDGQLVPVPANATLAEFLEWLKSRNAAEQAALPEYNVTSVVLEGSADDERAALKAIIKIQVNRADAPVRVSLFLNEAVLQETKYQGAGEAAFDGLDRTAGYRWWFRGKGEHELTLSLVVPVRKQLPTRRLQLAIPPTASSSLKLNVPLPRLSAKAPENSFTKIAPKGNSNSEIEVIGLGTRLDLQWQPLSNLKRVETVLHAKTRMAVELDNETATLTAEQSIQALQGSFSDVQVQLPSGFELVSVEGRQYSSHAVDDTNTVTVTFSEAMTTSEPVILTWILESTMAQRISTLTLEGFRLDDRARIQTGEIEIRSVEGYQITQREGQEVRRSNVSDPNGGNRLAGAYRFLKQPFRLVLDIQEIKPYFSIEPHLFLTLSQNSADLDALLHVHVHRGAVPEVELSWPNWKREGWAIEPLESAGLVEQFQIDMGDGEGPIRIRLLKRKHEDFELPLKARRTVVAGQGAVEFSLPTVNTSSRLPTILVVGKADNVEITDLVAQGETSIRPLSAELRKRIHLPSDVGRLRSSEYRIESPGSAHMLSTKVTVHKQQVGAETTAVVELQDKRLLVTQRLSYDVAYERLSQVRLLVPREIEGGLAFFAEDDSSLPAMGPNVDVEPLKTLRVTLPEPRIGRFELEARYFVDLPAELLPGREVPLRLPLVRSSDAEYSSVRFQFKNGGEVQATVDDEAWEQQLSLDASAMWMAAGPKSEIPLTLERVTGSSWQDFVVKKALVQTAFDADGFARSRGQYRIDGNVSTIVVTLPKDIVGEGFWWDKRLLAAERMDPATGAVQLEIPSDLARGEHLLTIDFRARTASEFGWIRAHRLSAPRFPPNLWIEQTVWELVLPFNQHLFTNADGFTPEFRWQRDGFLWNRRPHAAYAEAGRWIGDVDGPAARSEFENGNAYPFSSFGPTTSLAFDSMAQPIVVLFGAGLALAVGIVLLKIPATRNVLTILCVAFVLSLLGLQYTAPIQLLLQPAVVGLLLAVAAALIEGLVKRKRAMVLTLSSHSDFISPPPSSSSVDRNLAYGVGSEEPTAIRPASVSAMPEPASSVTGKHS